MKNRPAHDKQDGFERRMPAALVSQTQAFVSCSNHLTVDSCIAFQNLFTGREDFVELGGPGLADCLLGEAALNQIQHDGDRYRSARRSAQQGCDGAVLSGHQLSSELQNATLFRVL